MTSPYVLPGLIAPKIEPEKLIEAVYHAYGFDGDWREAATMKSNTRKISDPRQMSAFLLRSLTGWTLQRVALRFRQSHCTTIYSVRVIPGRLKYDKEIRTRFIAACKEAGVQYQDVNQILKECEK